MTTPRPISEMIAYFRNAVLPSFALLGAVQLDLFTALKDGPMASNQVAAALRVKIEKLEVLMYALVHMGFLDLADGRFSNSPDADHFLVRGKPNYLGDMYEAMPQRWEAAPTASFFS